MSAPRIYSFDSGAFIEGRKWFPMANYPSVWTAWDGLACTGRLRISEEAHRELRDDDVVAWLNHPPRARALYATDAELIGQFREVRTRFPNFPPPNALKGLADPWVIALAMLLGATVVTEESRAPHGKPPRIPDVCKALGVECVFLRQVAQLEGWVI